MKRNPRSTEQWELRYPPRDREGTRAVLEDLLTNPPDSLDELEDLVASLPPEFAPQAATELFARAAREVEHLDLASHVLAFAGCAGHEAALLGLFRDETLDRGARARAAALLSELAGDSLDEFTQGLPEAELQFLMESQIASSIRQSALISDGDQVLPGILAATPPEARPNMMELVEVVRAQLGVPAAYLYAPYLRREQPSDDLARLQEIVADEGTAYGLSLLTDSPVAAAPRKAVMRARTRRLEAGPLTSRADVRAFLSSCDGQAAYSLLVAVGEGTERYAAGVCIRAHEGLRNSYLFDGVAGGALEDLLESMAEAATCDFVEVPPTQAATLVAEAQARHPEDLDELYGDSPGEHRLHHGALAILDNLRHPEATTPPAPEPAQRLRPGLDELLAPERYTTWFLDVEDVPGLDLPTSDSKRAVTAWCKRIAKLLDGSDVHDRLRAMCLHAARFELAAGERSRARAFALLHKELQGPLPGSRLALHLLAEHLAYPPEDDDPMAAFFQSLFEA